MLCSRKDRGIGHAVASVRMINAYIGIGSNLKNPIAQVKQALSALSVLPGTQLIAKSHLYRSAPMGPQDQPSFINAAVALETNLSALALLHQLQMIELAQGRTREVHWGPRTLDLDLLLFGEEVINHPDLKVPHPGLHERNFVLYPLHDIAPELVIPKLGPLKDLLIECPDSGLELLD